MERLQLNESLLTQLQRYAPDSDVLVTAVEQLKDGLQMRGFFREYILSLEESGCNNPEEVAYENLGRVLSAQARETVVRWRIVFLKLKESMITGACVENAGLVRETIQR